MNAQTTFGSLLLVSTVTTSKQTKRFLRWQWFVKCGLSVRRWYGGWLMSSVSHICRRIWQHCCLTSASRWSFQNSWLSLNSLSLNVLITVFSHPTYSLLTGRSPYCVPTGRFTCSLVTGRIVVPTGCLKADVPADRCAYWVPTGRCGSTVCGNKKRPLATTLISLNQFCNFAWNFLVVID